MKEGESVIAFNHLGEVSFILHVSSKVPPGVVVAEGVWWLNHCPGPRSVNALTSQRLTDQGEGSTFYDNTVDVRMEGNKACPHVSYNGQPSILQKVYQTEQIES
jgi:anaerobic selenocysteine-containing dehydrogenase